MERNDLPYERGDIITDTGDDVRKLQVAWKHMADRQARLGADAIHRLSGLERSLQIDPAELAAMDDDLAPAYCMETLTELALEHMGGDPAVHDFMLFNRQTAAVIVAAEILLAPGDTVIGVSPSYSHPAVTRAVARAGATFVDTCGLAAFREALDASQDVAVVMLTRLAVTYEILPQRDLDEIVRLAKRAGARIIVDDAGGARVGPAMFGQAKSLELGVDIASTGLDKYGTVGPRLGAAGRRFRVGCANSRPRFRTRHGSPPDALPRGGALAEPVSPGTGARTGGLHQAGGCGAQGANRQ